MGGAEFFDEMADKSPYGLTLLSGRVVQTDQRVSASRDLTHGS